MSAPIEKMIDAVMKCTCCGAPGVGTCACFQPGTPQCPNLGDGRWHGCAAHCRCGQSKVPAPVWRCHGGRVRHRRARKPDGSLDSRSLCGMFEWERHWHEETGERWRECGVCAAIANPT